METAAMGLRGTRATFVATASTLIAVAAHDAADGRLPSPPGLGFLVLALTAAAMPFLARPASRARIVVLTVAGQLVAHATLGLAAGHSGVGTPSTSPMAAMPGTAHAHAGHASTASVVSRSSEHILAGGARMVLMHVLAAVVVGLWLAAGERAVWTLIRLVWGSLALPASPLPLSAPPRPAAPVFGTVRLVQRIAVGCVVRRGPPRLVGI